MDTKKWLEFYLQLLLIFIVFLGLGLALSSCGGNEDAEENAKKYIVLDEDTLIRHRFSNDLFMTSAEVVRVFDPELCVVFYITGSGGVGAPLPLAELHKTTSAALELSKYCEGRFK